MADEQYTWLDRATAEALLRGESLEAVDAAARDQAERLAKTLEALTAEPPPTSAALTGEFRAGRRG
ncbi:extensin, partial [Streptomyces sp. MBT33]|nr:extensin [Streptomyces sp. MBT33]